jgi:prepilin-type N-terminal cleavage/methylation domain-containing protein
VETRRRRIPIDGGFTLLELIVAVTILVSYLLPMMFLIAESKGRAVLYTRKREVRDLAQRKLFDRVHYYEERDAGDFSLEGHPSWTWRIDPPEMVGSGEQVLLEYRVSVELPQKLGDSNSLSAGSGESGSTFEMSVWAFPDERWYEDQAILYDQGAYSTLYGDPRSGGGY